jgi:hypothetical protein
MKSQFLFASLLVLTLNPLAAQACPTGNSSSLAYIRRDGNRCEGIQNRDVSGSLSLIAFSTSSLGAEFPDTMNIRLPGTDRTSPAIVVQSFTGRNYRLDTLDTTQTDTGYTFALNTNILQRADIAPQTLRASAFITRESRRIYFPVILGQPSGSYKFVINSPQRTSLPTFEIRRNGRAVYSSSRSQPQQGQVSLTWIYGDADAGSYELYIVDGEGTSRSFSFEHNPDWFE